MRADRQVFISSHHVTNTYLDHKIPTMTNNYELIDVDTPSSAHTYTSFADSSQWQLVFSDEFEVENRTFWPGDDPYWEAVNLHYWQVNGMLLQVLASTET